jgi:PEP-CTERM motif
MKKMLVLFAALVLAASFAAATPMACTAETLNNYLAAGFSCEIDNLLFSNFTYTGTANGTAPIASTAVNVTPITTPGDEGLEFNAGWSVSTPAEEDSNIGFIVSTVNKADTIDSLDLEFNGHYTGTGTSSVTENYCEGGLLASCPTTVNQIAVTNPPTVLSITSKDFTPVNTLQVSKDVNVSAGNGGTASISDLNNTYGQVPEPGTLGLLGGGLVALGLVRRRS